MFIPVYVLAPLLIVLAVLVGEGIRRTFFPGWDGRK